MVVDAKLYDGKSSKEYNVLIEFSKDGSVKIEQFGINEPISKVKISSRLGNTPRLIEFSNNIRCKVEDNDKLDEILNSLNVNKSFIHKLESSWKLAISVFIVMFIAIAFFLTVGSDYTANFIAKITPKHTLDYASKQTLKNLDNTILHKSNLTQQRKEQILKIFNEVTGGSKDYKLHFRSSPSMGPNAFALPSGDIVLLDELVFLDKDKNLTGIEGVLAHEMGHVVYRHSLKLAVKSTIATALISYITGDVSVIIASIPTILATTGYSREFEAQSDSFAIRRMKQLHKSTKPLASLFIEIKKYMKKKYGDDMVSVPNWLSSHPSTDSRIKMFQKN